MPDPYLRRALVVVAPYWRRLALVLTFNLASTALALYLPYLSKDLVDRALLGRDAATLLWIVLWFAGITLASFALNLASGLRYTRVSADILFDMRLAVYRHLQRLSPRFYARARLGDLVSRLNSDIAEIQRIAAESALAWVGNAVFLAGTIGLLAWLDARLFLLTALFFPPSLWALARYRSGLEDRARAVRTRSAEIGSFLVETLQGVRLVVASNAQEREATRFRQKNDAFVDSLMVLQLHSYVSGGLPALILSASSGFVFLYGGWRVVQGTLTLGTFVAFVAYQMRVFAPAQALMGLYASLAGARAALQRVYEILDTRPEVVETPDSRRLEAARGDVSFEEVVLAFDRGAPVLDRVSFAARAGETLAVVGPSGSGKSTIADLLLRLLDPDSGVVRLDGHDLRTLRLADLRRHVVLADQEPFLFHASIAENIRYGRPAATDADVRAAARAAGIDEFARNLPQGYETVAGERGMALSAGERQRIALARAFLADPAVLVLDEPTAALDPATAQRVMAGYRAVMQGRTTILISHRPELIRDAHRVVVLEGARIVEEGTPADLLRRDRSFSRLFRQPLAQGEPRARVEHRQPARGDQP